MASIELKFFGTFSNSDYLREFCCGCCHHYITEQDILGNYHFYVSDYANEVDKEEFFPSG